MESERREERLEWEREDEGERASGGAVTAAERDVTGWPLAAQNAFMCAIRRQKSRGVLLRLQPVCEGCAGDCVRDGQP